MTAPDLPALLESWELHLRALRRSPQTIRSYLTGVRLFLRWCADAGQPATLDRATLAGFVAHLLDKGVEAATARSRHLAVRRFSGWLAEEREIPRDELYGVQPPKLDEKVVESLTDEQAVAMVKACQGTSFRDRRDEAIVRLMLETGLRAEEALSMTVPDTNIPGGLAIVRRGKGGVGRTVPFGVKTAAAIDRYVRMRRTHRLAPAPALWLGVRGHTFGYFGLYDALQRRAEDAGIPGFHPHMLRHTAAARRLDAGGSEGGLMAVAGWSRSDMLHRYVKSTRERRAAEEARRLGIGDQL